MTQKWLFLVRVQIPVVIFDSQDNMWWQANDISPSVVLSRLAIAQLDVKHFDFTDIALEITISVHEARKELVKEVNFPQALLSNHQEGGCWELHLGPLEKQSSFQISFLHFWTQDYIYTHGHPETQYLGQTTFKFPPTWPRGSRMCHPERSTCQSLPRAGFISM